MKKAKKKRKKQTSQELFAIFYFAEFEPKTKVGAFIFQKPRILLNFQHALNFSSDVDHSTKQKKYRV